MADKHVTGPIQVFVIGFDKFEATGRIMAELRRVRKRGVIRLVDVIFVQKDRRGDIENSMHLTDLSEDERMRLARSPAGSSDFMRVVSRAWPKGPSSAPSPSPSATPAWAVDRMQELADSIPAGAPRRSSSSSTTGRRASATRSWMPAAGRSCRR